MADPVKQENKTKAVDIPQIPQVPSPAASEAEIASYNQYIRVTASKSGAPTAVIPGGVKIDATRFVGTRINPREAYIMLGDVDGKFVTEQWRSEHSGWKYMWPVQKSEETQAYIRTGRYVEVPFDAIDKTNSDVRAMRGVTGEAIWKQHVCVCVSPQVWFEDVTSAEHESIRRTALNRAAMENELTQAFGTSGFRGQVEITDVRKER